MNVVMRVTFRIVLWATLVLFASFSFHQLLLNPLDWSEDARWYFAVLLTIMYLVGGVVIFAAREVQVVEEAEVIQQRIKANEGLAQLAGYKEEEKSDD